MSKKEYLKYNNPLAYDMQGKRIFPKDTVVINNHYGRSPIIGVVDHFTESGNVAVTYQLTLYFKDGKSRVENYIAYRDSRSIIKIGNGNKSNSED